MSKHMVIWCYHCVRIINVHVLLNFYLLEGRNYARLSEFSGFSKCDNDVITCRGVRNFEWKPQLVGGCQKLPLYAKNHIWKPSSFFNQLGTYKQIYIYTYIQFYIYVYSLVFNSIDCYDLMKE